MLLCNISGSSSTLYYELEKYSGNDQSISRYKNYKEWLHGYWLETIHLCHAILEKGGRLCYILSDDGSDQTGKYYSLLDDMNNITSTFFKKNKYCQCMIKTQIWLNIGQPMKRLWFSLNYWVWNFQVAEKGYFKDSLLPNLNPGSSFNTIVLCAFRIILKTLWSCLLSRSKVLDFVCCIYPYVNQDSYVECLTTYLLF